MNEHCSQWSTNDHIIQSPISTVCGQYCVAFLMFRCRNISMHAFACLFRTDLIVNDCRVFDWFGALNKKWWKTSVFVSNYVNDVNNAYWYPFYVQFLDIQPPIPKKNLVQTVRLITDSIQRIPSWQLLVNNVNTSLIKHRRNVPTIANDRHLCN